MVLQFKTSFFEHLKNTFIPDLLQMKNITEVKNAIGAKASSETAGEAFVEYSLEIQFTVQDQFYSIKMIAYTTTCRIMVQPVDASTNTKVVSSNKFIPRYFVDTYLLPWCEQAYLKRDYDEKSLMEAINNEINGHSLLNLISNMMKLKNRIDLDEISYQLNTKNENHIIHSDIVERISKLQI